MPFTKNDPKTIEAAVKGGKTGKKHLETVSKAQQRKFGKLSGLRRRELKKQREKKADKYADKIMHSYIV